MRLMSTRARAHAPMLLKGSEERLCIASAKRRMVLSEVNVIAEIGS
jgi:hypothetical protein